MLGIFLIPIAYIYISGELRIFPSPATYIQEKVQNFSKSFYPDLGEELGSHIEVKDPKWKSDEDW